MKNRIAFQIFISLFILLAAPAFAGKCRYVLDLPPLQEIYKGFGRSQIHQTFQSAIADFWANEKIFAYDPNVPRDQTFVVDTPPPTLSGDLHLGHLVSFMQADTFIRFQRMLGRNVFFPLGWDSNGEPVHDRVVARHGVSIDKGTKKADDLEELEQGNSVSFVDFEKLAHQLIEADKDKNMRIMKDAGLSVDWTLSYDTMDWDARFTSQSAFLKLLAEKQIYFEPGSSEVDSQWKMRMQSHVPMLVQMAESLTILPKPLYDAKGQLVTFNYLKKEILPWLFSIDRDWNLSRSFPYGVRVPIWYPLDEQRRPQWSNPIIPSPNQLPIDPRVETPSGYLPEQRGQPGGFIEDERILSTWATSALTTLIQARWKQDPAAQRDVFPADFRWQGHDIIRTWLTFTLLATKLNTGEMPFSQVYINGMITDKTNQKMSKSLGNGIIAEEALAQFPSDYIRQLALARNVGLKDSNFSFDAEPKPDYLTQLSIFLFAKKILRMEELARQRKQPLQTVQMTPTFQLQRRAMDELARAIGQDYQDMNFGNLKTRFEEAHQIISFFNDESYPVNINNDFNTLLFFKTIFKDFLRLAAPAYPFATEVAWQNVFAGLDGEPRSVHQSGWPVSLTSQPDPDALSLFLILSKIVARDLGFHASFPKEYSLVIEGPEDMLKFIQRHEKELDLENFLLHRAGAKPKKLIYRPISDLSELRATLARAKRLGPGYAIIARTE